MSQVKPQEEEKAHAQRPAGRTVDTVDTGTDGRADSGHWIVDMGQWTGK